MSQVVETGTTFGQEPTARSGSLDGTALKAPVAIPVEAAGKAAVGHLQTPVVDGEYRFTGEGVRGLTFERRWTTPGIHPYDEIAWEMRTANISNESGKTVFEQTDIEVPVAWSQLATNVVVSKYFRGHIGTPGREKSVKQLIDRVVNTITAWAATQHYFATDEDLQAFQAELTHLLVHQKMAFNSPVWFNVGVEERPQCSACFINSVQDSMSSIMDLAKTEAMLFKYGSGAGVNLSPIRGSKEKMSGGGIASGPVSFMKGFDAFAGVVKCLTADTYVVTTDGLLRIEEAIPTAGPEGFEQSDAVTLNTPAGPTTISQVYRSPLAATRSIRLRSGLRLTGTYEHPVLTLDKDFQLTWTKLADIRPGTRVAVERSRELWPTEAPSLSDFRETYTHQKRQLRYPDEVTPELARLLGYLVSEGSIDQERFRFTSADPEIMADYCACVEAVFGIDCSAQVTATVHPRTGVRTQQIALSWKGALQFLEFCGLPAGRSATKAVPVVIRRSPRSLVLAFLGAYVEGDGHVGKRSIEIASASDWLLEEVQLLALNMGVVGRRSTIQGYGRLAFLGEDAARLSRLLLPHLVTPRKQMAARALMVPATGRRNPNLDVIPGLVTALRSLFTTSNGWAHTPAGAAVQTGFGLFNRVGDNVSYARAAEVTGLVESVSRISPALGETVRAVMDDHYLWDEVVTARDAGTALTYDFTVPGVHAFVSNGIVSHNSGGKTRRAAKMVILDADHPDVMDFIESKAGEERKAWALIEAGYDPSFTGEAYGSVFFQNANHSVRVTDDFMHAVQQDGDWTTREVTTGEAVDTFPARTVFRKMAEAAWLCGDPGIQYDTIINDWHTSAVSDRIYASNPCSEYMFLNDTACFAPETRISTPDGLRSIVELFHAQEFGEQVLVTTDLQSEHDHRRLTAHRPAVVTEVGERPVFRMRLADGREIRTTADHRFLTNEGEWKELRDLRVGLDRVAIRESGNPVAFASSRRDVDRWQMLGWMTGDGVFSKDTAALVFGPTERSTADRMEGEFQSLVAEAQTREATLEAIELDLSRGALLTAAGVQVPTKGRTSHISTQSNGVMQISSGSGAVVRMLEDRYGFKQGTATEKDVPSEVHRIPDDLKVAYLQGLFSADGTIRQAATATEPEVMLASSSPALLRSVQLLLADLGITSRITWTHPTGRKNPQGQLHIYNQQARAYMALVGFSCSATKQGKVDDIIAGPFMGALKQPRAPRVISVEPDGVETVYDITEPFTHSVVAEGMIAHNCNLASMNLMKFVGEDGEFDVEAYQFASRVTITAQEILVDNASYPTPQIEENSHRFRPLGIGYANLGALLMSRGLAYDSDAGRQYAATLTAIMTGEAYRQSAVIARDHGGAYNDYAINEVPFLRVLGKHRDAAYDIPGDGAPRPLIDAARLTWDEALELGRQFGYRNAQVSVLAPTGTIAFMMDCDTTGIEPDIALVKYKKLVGEGFLKIVNNTVPGALRKLGYSAEATEEIVRYINERETIEGAPGLKPEHLAVFDCAFKPVNGERSIHYMGHVRMMGATQPFLSGAISKTVNMPEAATAEDIEDVYLQGWKLGLKAIAIYRDGSKRSQPLSTGKKKDADSQSAVAAASTDLQLTGEPKAYRRRLPAERAAVTHKFQVAGHEGYITVGLYEDGQPGELFLKMAKEGSTISGLMDTIATMTSVSLQYGVPLRDLVNKFAHVRFEPAGFTGNNEIPIAKSIVDYVFRWMGSRFLPSEEREALGLIGAAPVGAFALSSVPSTTSLSASATSEVGGAAALAQPSPVTDASTPATDAPIEPALALPVLNGNGSGKGNGHGTGVATASLGAATKVSFSVSADSPSCADCGSIMVRNGSCYKCLNCGSTSGCS